MMDSVATLALSDKSHTFGASQAAKLLLAHPQIDPLLQARARAKLHRVDVKANTSLHATAGFTASDIRQTFNPVTSQMRRVNELPDSFATGVEGVDVDRHRQIL
jgi:hypothetical protein